MASIHSLVEALDERTIAKLIGIPHDEARMAFPLRSNTASSFSRFEDIIGDYCNYHYTTCVTGGGFLPRAEAVGRAKQLIEHAYGRRGNIISAYNDAHEGLNGGMRQILDIITDGIKSECVERYVRQAFDDHVSPNSWDKKQEIIRQFFAAYGAILPASVDTRNPARYANDYQVIISAYVQALQQTSAIFRRM